MVIAMLTYSLSRTSGTPLYEELYRFIRRDIETGLLPAGQKLPSKRSLAQHLGVSVVTVETAYAQLGAEGYIQCRARSGTYVNALSTAVPCPAPASSCLETTVPSYRIDLSRSYPGELFPFTIWSRLLRNTIAEQENRFSQPLTPYGADELRTAIAAYLRRARGLRVSPAQIIIGAGTEYLYQLLILLLGSDLRYAVENPGYQKISRIYQLNGAACLPLPLDDAGLSIAALRSSAADVVHISPAHHYPTGLVMPIARRQELLAWAQEGQHYIIEDEYDSEFRFLGRPLPPLFGSSPDERVIYINTFSQTISPSIRISYLCLPPHLMERYRRTMDFLSCTVPVLEQLTLAKFIADGYFERHLNRMKTYYRKKRKLIFDCLANSPLTPFLTLREENAGLHFLVRLQTEVPDAQLKAAAAEKGIRLSFLSDFFADSQEAAADSHTLLINYSSLDPADLAEVLTFLADFLAGPG